MNFSMASKFAIKNLKAHKNITLPFALANGTMLMLYNVVYSLLKNEYVSSRNSLKEILLFCSVVVAIITIIITLYSNKFLSNKRNKEYALYSVLGLEKRDIRYIIFIEYGILFAFIFLFSIIGGYAFGHLSFLLLNKVTLNLFGTAMNFDFSKDALISTASVAFCTYFIIFLLNGLSIQLNSATQLFAKEHKGESEPRLKIIILILGIISLFGGYYIALKSKGSLESLLLFMIAAILVMFGTYCLYTALSIAILKYQKTRKSYYEAKNFLTVSGLMFRMKKNAVSLASIAIMSTAIIITSSVTATVYFRSKDFINSVVSRDYKFRCENDLDKDNIIQEKENLRKIVYSSVEDSQSIKNDYIEINFASFISADTENTMLELKNADMSAGDYFFNAIDLEAYNKKLGKNEKLNDNEVLICTNINKRLPYDTIKIGDKIYNVKKVDNFVGVNVAVQSIGVVTKDFDNLKYISQELSLKKSGNRKQLTLDIYWDANGVDKENYQNKLFNIKDKYNLNFESRQFYEESIYELNGGLLFIGIIISIVFIIGTVLIIYFKQINEGYEDRDKYKIMEKIGLEDKLIKKVIASQIVWIFATPLVVATIHCFVASKIIYQILGMFAVFKYMQYGIFLLSTIMVFCISYYIVYKITSKAYYNIVK